MMDWRGNSRRVLYPDCLRPRYLSFFLCDDLITAQFYCHRAVVLYIHRSNVLYAALAVLSRFIAEEMRCRMADIPPSELIGKG